MRNISWRLAVLLLLIIGGLLMAAASDQSIKAAAGSLCVQVNQPPNFDQLNTPPLSTHYQINPQTHGITKTIGLEGMPSKAVAPNGKYAVYWKPLDSSGQPQMGLHVYSAQTQSSILLTTLYSMALSGVDRSWAAMPDYDWSSPSRWSPDSHYLAYVGYNAVDSTDNPALGDNTSVYLGMITADGVKHDVDLSTLVQKPKRIVIHGWSADNRYLAFSVSLELPSSSPTKTLWVWDADTATVIGVPIPYDIERGMGIWSPTGHQLVVVAHSADSDDYQLTLWSPEKGILSQVPWFMRYGFIYWLEWSPDGKHLVSIDLDLESAEFDLIYGYSNDRLAIPTDKILRNLYAPADPESNFAHTLLARAWFDNGDALVTYADYTTNREDLERLNLNTNVDVVLQSEIESVYPSPDGRSTLFAHKLDGKDAVDLIDATGARKRFVTLDFSPLGPYVVWSGDSRYAAFLGRDADKTLIVSVDGERQWTILGADFFWLEPDWLVYTKIGGDVPTVKLFSLKTSQTFALGKIVLEAPIPYASLSPDEKKIVFRSGDNELTLYYLDDGHSQILTAYEFQIPDPIPGFYNGQQRYYNYDRSPAWLKEHFAWSPDSAYFAYWGFTSDKNETRNMLRIHSIDSAEAKLSDTYDLASGYIATFSVAWNTCQ